MTTINLGNLMFQKGFTDMIKNIYQILACVNKLLILTRLFLSKYGRGRWLWLKCILGQRDSMLDNCPVTLSFTLLKTMEIERENKFIQPPPPICIKLKKIWEGMKYSLIFFLKKYYSNKLFSNKICIIKITKKILYF